MSAEPRLLLSRVDEPVRAVAVVLHGGRARSRMPVRATQLAVLRMRPFVTSLRRAAAGRGLLVAQVRYRVRGWNGAERAPVADLRWALDRLAERYPERPVALVGHSMGGRAAVYAAGHPAVRTVVGLAPWLEGGDPVAPLAGRRLLIAHGDRDRMTDPRASRSFARAAAAVAESTSYLRVAGGHHAMLRRARLWHRISTGFVLGTLSDVLPGPAGSAPADDELAAVLDGALAGEATQVV